jgi:hypothetical protein
VRKLAATIGVGVAVAAAAVTTQALTAADPPADESGEFLLPYIEQDNVFGTIPHYLGNPTNQGRNFGE